MPKDSDPVRWAGRQAVVTLPEHIDVSNAGQVREELLSVINRGDAALIADMTAAPVLRLRWRGCCTRCLPRSGDHAARSSAMLAARPQPQFTVQALEVAQAHAFASTPSSTTVCSRCSTSARFAHSGGVLRKTATERGPTVT